jgi:hypothetical protein
MLKSAYAERRGFRIMGVKLVCYLIIYVPETVVSQMKFVA